jgi:cyclase
MPLPRIIPCLLLRNGGLVKTVRFAEPKYVGDPINAVKIFNDKQADELALLDIAASREGRGPDFRLLQDVADEAFMPLAYGGGLRSLDEIRRLFQIGFEKAVLNSAPSSDPTLLRAAADRFGSQSVVYSIDVRGNGVFTHGGTKADGRDPVEAARWGEAQGAGEILLNSIDRDGTREGYDLDLVRRVSAAVRVPVVAVGGAGRLEHLVEAIRSGGASAAGAGSLFVFHGRHRAVLISYPGRAALQEAFGDDLR